MPRAPRATSTALVAGAAGGALLLVATFLPWSRRGAGSTISLRRVADLVLSGTVDAWVPRGIGLVVYCIPLGGALLLIGTGLGGRLGTAIGAVGLALAVTGTGLAVVALSAAPRGGVGGGTVAALTGAVLGGVGVSAGRRTRRQPPPPARPLGTRTDGTSAT